MAIEYSFMLTKRESRSYANVLDFLEGQPEVPEHEHLITRSWGGSELDEVLSNGARDGNSELNRVVHEVKLYYWPKPQA